MKVWITKYALSAGIIEAEGGICEGNSAMIQIQREGRYPELLHGEGKDWHRSAEAAINKANEMRLRKIKGLEAQISKLVYLKFKLSNQ